MCVCVFFCLLVVDECLDGLDNCTYACVNTIGGYVCECEPGFENNGPFECVGNLSYSFGLWACIFGGI